MEAEYRDADASPVESASSTFMPWASLAHGAPTWLGLAAFLGWVNLMFGFEGVLRDQVLEQGGLVHDPAVLATTVAAGAVLLAGLAVGRVLPRAKSGGPVGGRYLPAAVGAVGAACSVVLVALTALAPESAGVLPYLLGAVLGACLGVSILTWGARLAKLDLREALLAVTAASGAQWLPFVLVTVTGAPAHAVVAAALPLASGFVLARGAGVAEPMSRGAKSQPAEPAGSSTLARLSATMFVFSATAMFAWCFFVKLLPGHLSPNLFPTVFAVTFAATAAAGFLCALLMERQRSYRLELHYRACMLFCLCGVAATGMASGAGAEVGDADLGLFASYAMVYAGYSLVQATMWMLSLGYVYLRRERPAKVFGSVFAGQYLGFCTGIVLVEIIVRSPLGGVGWQIVPVAVFCCVLALGIAYLAVFPERELLGLSPLMFGMSHESVDARSEQIAREHGLTPREAEVLAILARGRDITYVVQELGISKNTANVHRKNVYAKLGVHSQQDLLTLIEAAGYGE